MSDDYDIDKLIELAKQAPSSVEEKLATLREPSEAHKFVLANSIKAGKDKFSFQQIYYLYKQWASEPVNTIHFGRQFSKLFKRYRGSAGSFYLLDPEAFGSITNVESKQAETKT
jgi:hypothetical protein